MFAIKESRPTWIQTSFSDSYFFSTGPLFWNIKVSHFSDFLWTELETPDRGGQWQWYTPLVGWKSLTGLDFGVSKWYMTVSYNTIFIGLISIVRKLKFWKNRIKFQIFIFPITQWKYMKGQQASNNILLWPWRFFQLPYFVNKAGLN